MSDNKDLEQIERELRERFSPADMYDLIVHGQARTELYHRQLESALERRDEELRELREQLRLMSESLSGCPLRRPNGGQCAPMKEQSDG